MDPRKPKGQRFLGVSVVEAVDFGAAVDRAWELKINPGGEVAGIEVKEEDVPAQYHNRLLPEEELLSTGIGTR